jgi:heat shock protein HtpX
MGATAKTLLLMGVLTGLLGALGFIFWPGNPLAGLALFVVLAAVMNFFAYWFSDKMALRMAGAKEVTPEEAPRLHRVVDELMPLSKLPKKPKVYLINNPSPNAFATGRNPQHAVVAATTGIMDLLDDRELKGVMAHELGHVGNRDILIGSVAAVIAGAISWITTSMMWSMMFGRRDGGGGLLGLAAIILMPMAAGIVQMSISRTREYQADKTGAQTTHDPDALADALAKLHQGAVMRPMQVNPSTAHMYIVNPLAGFKGQNFSNLFSTHPPIEDRIARLREMGRRGVR